MGIATHCKHCGRSFKQTLLFAMMVDFGGAKMSPPPDHCPDGPNHEHDFYEPDPPAPVEPPAEEAKP